MIENTEPLNVMIDEFISWRYNMHVVVGGGLGLFMFWLMNYHPEVFQTLMRSISDLGPESIGVGVGV